MELRKDWDVMVKKAIRGCTPNNYKLLLAVLGNFSPSMFIPLIDESICTQMLTIITQVNSVLDKKGHSDSINLLTNISETFNGMQYILNNRNAIEYIHKLFGEEEFTDQIAGILIVMMRNSMGDW